MPEPQPGALTNFATATISVPIHNKSFRAICKAKNDKFASKVDNVKIDEYLFFIRALFYDIIRQEVIGGM